MADGAVSPAGPKGGPAARRYHGRMSGLEIFFISLLAVTTLAIGWFAALSVYKLYRGQR